MTRSAFESRTVLCQLSHSFSPSTDQVTRLWFIQFSGWRGQNLSSQTLVAMPSNHLSSFKQNMSESLNPSSRYSPNGSSKPPAQPAWRLAIPKITGDCRNGESAAASQLATPKTRNGTNPQLIGNCIPEASRAQIFPREIKNGEGNSRRGD